LAMDYSFQRCARRRRRPGRAPRNREGGDRESERPDGASAFCQRKKEGPEVPNALVGETTDRNKSATHPGGRADAGSPDALSTKQASDKRPSADKRKKNAFDQSLACHGHSHEVDKNPSRDAKSAPRTHRQILTPGPDRTRCKRVGQHGAPGKRCAVLSPFFQQNAGQATTDGRPWRADAPQRVLNFILTAPPGACKASVADAFVRRLHG